MIQSSADLRETYSKSSVYVNCSILCAGFIGQIKSSDPFSIKISDSYTRTNVEGDVSASIAGYHKKKISRKKFLKIISFFFS